MGFDDPLAERQAEPGTFPGRLGGEERVKDSRSDLRRDAGPGVGHFQANQRSRRLEPRRHHDRARRTTLTHCVMRVGHKIDDDLVELVRIGPQGRDVVG